MSKITPQKINLARLTRVTIFVVVFSFLIGISWGFYPKFSHFWQTGDSNNKLKVLVLKGFFSEMAAKKLEEDLGFGVEWVTANSDADFIDKALSRKSLADVFVSPSYLSAILSQSKVMAPLKTDRLELEAVAADFADLNRAFSNQWVPWVWEVWGLSSSKALKVPANMDPKSLFDYLKTNKLKLKVPSSAQVFIEFLKSSGTLSQEWIELEKSELIESALEELKSDLSMGPKNPSSGTINPSSSMEVEILGHGAAAERKDADFLIVPGSYLVIYHLGIQADTRKLNEAYELIESLTKARLQKTILPSLQKASTHAGTEGLEMPSSLKPSHLRTLPIKNLSLNWEPQNFQKSVHGLIAKTVLKIQEQE